METLKFRLASTIAIFVGGRKVWKGSFHRIHYILPNLGIQELVIRK